MASFDGSLCIHEFGIKRNVEFYECAQLTCETKSITIEHHTQTTARTTRIIIVTARLILHYIKIYKTKTVSTETHHAGHHLPAAIFYLPSHPPLCRLDAPPPSTPLHSGVAARWSIRIAADHHRHKRSTHTSDEYSTHLYATHTDTRCCEQPIYTARTPHRTTPPDGAILSFVDCNPTTIHIFFCKLDFQPTLLNRIDQLDSAKVERELCALSLCVFLCGVCGVISAGGSESSRISDQRRRELEERGNAPHKPINAHASNRSTSACKRDST